MTIESEMLARRVRAHTLKMVAAAKASHVGGALSMVDILAVLYGGTLRVDPSRIDLPDRDRFILSKGHSCSAVYATLASCGFFPESELATYGQDGSRLMAHISHKVPGVEFSTGSLGHGLSFGCGKALAAKRRRLSWRTFIIISDGELDEGSNWEAILFAPHHHLDNLILIVDYNKIQSLGSVHEVLDLAPLAQKFTAFNWAVREINGHDHAELRGAMRDLPFENGKPSCIIAHTTKGKGVDFMENELAWHYRSPDNDQLIAALSQIGD